MRSLQNWEEIKKEMEGEGIRKENIKMAFELMERIQTLDEIIFPEKPRPFRFSSKESHPGEIVGYVSDNADDEDRFYGIFLENLSKNLTELKRDSRLIIARGRRYTWEDLFMAVAAHEVRHRLQFNCSIKKFSPMVAISITDQLLRDAIKLVELEFDKKRQILKKRRATKKYIEHVLDSLEFDAKVIEEIVAYKVHKKASLGEIISTIQMQAP